MHFHIHWLIHSIRQARLLGWNIRLLGTVLLMLLFSAFQFGAADPDSALTGSKESRRFAIGAARTECALSPAASGSRGLDWPGSRFAAAPNAKIHVSVFLRLEPGIYLIPRKDRLPKPKSVYRICTRAPGGNSDSPNEWVHRTVS